MHKTKIFFIALFSIILLPITLAQNSDAELRTYKQSYSKFETLQGELQLTGIKLSRDLTLSNLKLIDVNGINIPISKNLIKTNNNSYAFYFDVPNINSGKYTIQFSDVYYTKNGISSLGSFNITLNVEENNKTILSIKPAYYFKHLQTFEETQFSLIVKNSGNQVSTVQLDTEDTLKASANNFVLGAGQTKIININSNIFKKQGDYFKTTITLKYSDGEYDIPVLLERESVHKKTNETAAKQDIINLTNQTTPTSTNLEKSMLLTDTLGGQLEEIKVRVKQNITYSADTILINGANITMHDVFFTLKPYDAVITITPEKIEEIKASEKIAIKIDANKNKNLETNYTGELIVKSKEGAILKVPVLIILEKETKSLIQEPNITFNASTNKKPTNQKSDNAARFWIVTLAVFLVLILLIIFIYKKSKPKEEEFEMFIDRAKKRQ